MSRVFALLAVFALLSCRSKPAARSAPEAPGASEPASVSSAEPSTAAPNVLQTECASELDHLRELARCLERAVVVLNREPSDGELAAYLKAANEADPNMACPEPLATVRWSHDEGSLSHFDDGSAEAVIEYTFSTPSCGAVLANVTLVMP